MKIAVVTNCSGRKALSPSPQLTARSLPVGSARQVAAEWSRRLSAAEQWMPAKRLYQGRAFCEALRTAEMTRHPLHIVSAGVSFIRDTDLIPPYNLTASNDHPDSIQKKIQKAQLSEWWDSMNAVGISKRSLGDWIRSLRDTLIVFALTPNYMSLISRELASLPAKDLERVRLIGLRGKSTLPEPFVELTMPYDGRMNGRDSPLRGTESDFPQRAARHFVSLIQDRPRLAAASRHAQMVRKTLDAWRYESRIVRQRLPEAALRRVVCDVFKASGDHWTVALRALRLDLNIACEQGRFRAFCQELKAAKK